MIANTQTIPDGRPGTLRTLHEMERLVQAGKRNPVVRSRMIREALNGVQERNSRAEVKAVLDWVRRRVRYVRDPDTIELIQGADTTLNIGHGDCDDFVILARSALESIGYPTRSKVVGRDRDNYAHVLMEVYDPKERRWFSIDPIAKDKPFGWQPLAAASEVYPNMGDHTALMTGYPLRYRERKPYNRLMQMGINPLWLDQRAEAALLVHEMQNRPGNYGPVEGAKGLTLQAANLSWQWMGSGGYATVSKRGAWGSSVGGLAGLGDLGADYGPDADAQAKMIYRQAGQAAVEQMQKTLAERHHIKEMNLQAHELALRLMAKYGGGAVLKGSKPPATGQGVWRHGPYRTQGGGDQLSMCGPYRCYDIVNLYQHPWAQNEAKLPEAIDHIKNFIWYPYRGWGGKDRQGKDLHQWDETGGVIQYAAWLHIADVQEGAIPRLPPGYVTDWRNYISLYMDRRESHLKYRARKKKAQARVLTYGTLGVGAAATAITGGLLGPAISAVLGPAAGAVAGSAAVKGGAALAGVLGGMALNKEAEKKLEEFGLKQFSAEQVKTLNNTKVVEDVATKKPGATTGNATLDEAIRYLNATLGPKIQQALLQQKILAAGYGSAPVYSAGPGGGLTPQFYGKGAEKPSGGIGTTGTVAIAVGGAALLLGLGFLLFRR